MSTPPISPLGGATIIGAPKIDDFPPLSEPELGQIVGPLQQALAQGIDPQQPAAIPTFLLCRLIQTVRFGESQWKQLYELVDATAQALANDEIAINEDTHPDIFMGLWTHIQAVDLAQREHAKRVAVNSLDATPAPEDEETEDAPKTGDILKNLLSSLP